MNLFDIIGPVMTGPSSSHTAGAVRIGNAAREIFAKKPDKVIIKLYNKKEVNEYMKWNLTVDV